MSGGAGGVQINDALVAAAAEPQADIVLVLHKIAVHQHVDVLQKLVGHLAPPGTGLQNVALIGVAGVAPDGLVGVQRLYTFYKGQQGALVFRLQRLAPQQGQPVDVARLQTLQDLVAHLFGKGRTVVKIPRHGVEAVGAAAAAARNKQAGAHTLPVGNITIFNGSVIHNGRFSLTGGSHYILYKKRQNPQTLYIV